MRSILLFLGLVQSVLAVRIIGIEYLLFGGDYDENGCKPSAGYIWCNETQDCIPINQLCLPDIPEIFVNLSLPAIPEHEM